MLMHLWCEPQQNCICYSALGSAYAPPARSGGRALKNLPVRSKVLHCGSKGITLFTDVVAVIKAATIHKLCFVGMQGKSWWLADTFVEAWLFLISSQLVHKLIDLAYNSCLFLVMLMQLWCEPQQNCIFYSVFVSAYAPPARRRNRFLHHLFRFAFPIVRWNARWVLMI